MTYHKKVPDFVFPEYSIDFSIDEDCIRFLRTHFNDSVAQLFIRIPKGNAMKHFYCVKKS